MQWWKRLSTRKGNDEDGLSPVANVAEVLRAEASKTLAVTSIPATRLTPEMPVAKYAMGDPYSDLGPRIQELMTVCARLGYHLSGQPDPKVAELAFDDDPGTQARIGLAVCRYMIVWGSLSEHTHQFGGLLGQLIAKRAECSEIELEWILCAVLMPEPTYRRFGHVTGAARLADRLAKKQPLGERSQRLLMEISRFPSLAENTRARLCQLGRGQPLATRPNPAGMPLTPLVTAETNWGKSAFEFLDSMEDGERQSWIDLINHAATVSGSTPSGIWMKEGLVSLEQVGKDAFERRMMDWIPIFQLSPGGDGAAARYFARRREEKETVAYKGLVCFCSFIGSPDLAIALADLCLYAYRQDTFIEKVASSAIMALGEMPNQVGIPQLTKIKSKLRHKIALKNVEKALTVASQKAGMGKDALQESLVPEFGMVEVGSGSIPIGDYTLEFQIESSSRIAQSWKSSASKVQSSVPAAVKADHASELKALKDNLKELQKQLSTHRERFDQLMRRPISWRFDWWRKYYLDHLLIGWFSRRLIWQFSDGGSIRLGCWNGEGLVDSDDKPLGKIADDATVAIYHPAGFDEDVIVAWRDWIVGKEIVQPFKQAFREVYLVTPAELQTATYSNRFAAHIVRTNQVLALAKTRGWTVKPMGGSFDGAGEDPPRIPLPEWNLTAEYWTNPINDAHDDMGSPLYLTTDQVKFLRDGEALPISQVPMRVFTEIMRDVDLFVGVGSIANDPNWADSGERPDFDNYWRIYSFGKVSGAGASRRAVLEKLLPRMKIAPRCKLDDRFLIVKGDLKTYKIHLGSGNILIDSGIYLCIVPHSSPSGKIYLPFEGDTMLSVIISKALMLAEDSKIKDESILRQIKRS